ncbi:MAG: hypothetical protein PSV17_02225 [Methylotenera sp.]|uniref:hypothetical protein n=1 Tax=Methylotenera sp. TaxID=2051956 RepID=UPI002488342F|nr:hypothetical protein [Methylotenera sp.]MDI1308235.1 hypothetical protein [Methylotenera sp.]
MDNYKIMSDFGAFIESNPSLNIRDVSVLPYPKEIILGAITNILKTDTTLANPKLIAEGLILLADFQEGVHAEELSILGIRNKELSCYIEGEITGDEILEKILKNTNEDAYKKFSNIVNAERQKLCRDAQAILVERAKLLTVIENRKQNEISKSDPPDYVGSFTFFFLFVLFGTAGINSKLQLNISGKVLFFSAAVINILLIISFHKILEWHKSYKGKEVTIAVKEP